MRDITPDIDNKVDFIADYERFLPPIFLDILEFIPKFALEKSLTELDTICSPTTSDKSFKILFWRKLRDAEKFDVQMTDLEARCGLISKACLVRFTENSNLLAWLLTPDMPADVTSEVQLVQVAKRLRILLDFDATDVDKPMVDYKFLDAQMKLYTMLDKRVNGDFLQKIEEKSLRINHNTNVIAKKTEANKALSLEDQVKQLEQKLSSAQNLGGSVQVQKVHIE